MRNVIPDLTAEGPFSYIVFAILPLDTVRVVIDNSNTPRHNDVVANGETSVADQIAPSNERAIPNTYLATSLLKTYVGMNHRLITDPQTISRDPPNAPPSYGRPAADGNCSRTSAAPAKNSVNYVDN
jgi:hypothetical protein